MVSGYFTAGTACEIAGIESPALLRNWHVRMGLAVGYAPDAGGHRRYTFADCTLLRFVREFTEAGLSSAIAIAAVPEVRDHLAQLATLENIRDVKLVAIIHVAGGELVRVEIVDDGYGDALPRVRRAAESGPAIVVSLTDIVLRTQGAFTHAEARRRLAASTPEAAPDA